jgi:Cyclic GMP-AMP synthase DncV-like, nucleotidyltransferase domain
MADCSADVLSFHDHEVTLPQAERTGMRDRRDANRKRIKNGLEDQSKPDPIEFCTQGSYAMKTMVQHPENDYDIDDGIYFEATALVGPRGAEMSSLSAREMVRDAVDDGSFKAKPVVLPNCVRVQYDAGYRVDIPVYRRVLKKGIFADETFFELASSDWKRSDARDVTAWFDKENEEKSPDEENGRQLRRLCRLLKKFSQSRPSWRDAIASGFMITKLATECYKADANREDLALHNAMRAIRDRLSLSLIVQHPVTPNDTITKGEQDPKAKFLREKLSDAVKWLEPALKDSCTRGEALGCWDKVFNTTYFSDLEKSTNDDGAGGDALTAGLVKSFEETSRNAVRKGGGGTYA